MQRILTLFVGALNQQTWKRVILLLSLMLALLVLLRPWFVRQRTNAVDSLTYWFGPRVFLAGHNPYIPTDLRGQLEFLRGESLITNVPDSTVQEVRAYLATPINLLLYLPFSCISDYSLFLAAYWCTYLAAMAGALWLWVSLMTHGLTARIVETIGLLALWFLGSPALRWSLRAGQIDYLYFLPLSAFAYLYLRGQHEGNRNKAMWAGALLALAGFIKVFPGFLLVPLFVAYALLRLRGARQEISPGTRHLARVLAGAGIASCVLLLATVIFPGYEMYLQWGRVVWSHFVNVEYSHNLAHFVSLTLRGGPVSDAVLVIVYVGFLGATWWFLFGRGEHISVLHVSGMIAALPTFCWFWQDYYYVVLLLPAVVALTTVAKMACSRGQKVLAVGIVMLLFAATQVISGTGQLQAFLRVPLPSFLAHPLPEMQMEYWPQFLVYPASVMLWGFLWFLQRKGGPSVFQRPFADEAIPDPKETEAHLLPPS
jgi:hypothetical protein